MASALGIAELRAEREALGRRKDAASLELERLCGVYTETEKAVARASEREAAAARECARARERLQQVEGDVDLVRQQARPVLSEAEHGVREVSLKDIEEIRRLPDPPPAVRQTCELLHAMLNPKALATDAVAWDPHVRRTLSRTDLLSRVLSFDPDAVATSPDLPAALWARYLGGHEAVDFSSPHGVARHRRPLLALARSRSMRGLAPPPGAAARLARAPFSRSSPNLVGA
eukprot:CAMPEP_0206248464 /NCGR_PEP_ID=MMETSP0047_2-20121206/20385_1 /ASSEMBLY_ACC=CAM_ASM_000192 /TAXON_ID=195065 /ORGANISM="Chroomonas mesostigmatica_cf, Strain CCMP1168" /LENGTH=230 /DNA_ID=CAMNT_0053674113 /DNA_START=27 /DNA_END=715 /DNA_ORIENTATION=+